MVNVDWGLLQLQYEILGVSVEELAKEYGLAPRVISYAADERGWKRNSLAVSSQDYPSNTSDSSDQSIADLIADKQKLLTTVKRATLLPQYIALEAALLGKCLKLVNHLADDDPTNAKPLKEISEIYSSLKHGPNPGKTAAEDQSNRPTAIQIINDFGGSGEPPKQSINDEPVTVTISDDLVPAERSAPGTEKVIDNQGLGSRVPALLEANVTEK